MADISKIVADRIAAAGPDAVDEEAHRRQRVRERAEKWLNEWAHNLEAPGADPVALPPGVQGDVNHCVMANGLGGSFGIGSWTLPIDRLAAKLGYTDIALPDYVSEFIRRFDNGEYPDLILDADTDSVEA